MKAFSGLTAKLVATVAVMGALACTLAAVSVWSNRYIAAQAEATAASAELDILAFEARSGLLTYVRKIEFLVAELTPPQVEATRKEAADGLATALQRLDALAASSIPDESRAAVAKSRALVADYQKAEAQINKMIDAHVRSTAQATMLKASPLMDEAIATLDQVVRRNGETLRRTVADAQSVATSTERMTVAGSVLGILFCLALSLGVIVLAVTRPLARLISAMLAVAGGDLTVAMPVARGRDEIGSSPARSRSSARTPPRRRVSRPNRATGSPKPLPRTVSRWTPLPTSSSATSTRWSPASRRPPPRCAEMPSACRAPPTRRPIRPAPSPAPRRKPR
jgi:hypothetical protein